jgi:copper chaperone
MVKVKLLAPSVHCTSCKKLIEGEAEALGAKANVDVGKKTVDLEFDEKRVTLQDLRNAFKEVGFDSKIAK